MQLGDQAGARTSQKYPWLAQLLARKPAKIADVTSGNKMAHIARTVLKEIYRERPMTSASVPAMGR
jgi:hypothetical protein